MEMTSLAAAPAATAATTGDVRSGSVITAPSGSQDYDRRVGKPVRFEPKRIYYSTKNNDDFDPRICLCCKPCPYGHRRPEVRRCCRGCWSLSQLHPFYMIFWTPRNTAFTESRRWIVFSQIILMAVIITEIIFCIVIVGIDQSYTVSESGAYQFVKGLIVGIFVFVYSNIGREVWSGLYRRITVDEKHPPPLFFRCWQDNLLVLMEFGMIGLMIGLGYLCAHTYREQTGTVGPVPSIAKEICINIGYGLMVSFSLQTFFMFFIGYVPRSWVDWGKATLRNIMRCGCCRKPKDMTEAELLKEDEKQEKPRAAGDPLHVLGMTGPGEQVMSRSSAAYPNMSNAGGATSMQIALTVESSSTPAAAAPAGAAGGASAAAPARTPADLERGKVAPHDDEDDEDEEEDEDKEEEDDEEGEDEDESDNGDHQA